MSSFLPSLEFQKLADDLSNAVSQMKEKKRQAARKGKKKQQSKRSKKVAGTTAVHCTLFLAMHVHFKPFCL
jgi:hypothetical protein